MQNWRKQIGRRALIAFGHDVVMAGLAFLAALGLRLGNDFGTFLNERELWFALAIYIGVCACVFWSTGLYRGIWRYASVQDIVNIVRAVTLATLVFLPITFLATRLEAVPRSALVIAWLLLVVLLGAPRMLYRMWKDQGFAHLLERGSPYRVPVLLVGAGDAADLFLRDTARNPDSPYRIVGILDDKGTRVGRNIRGVEVLGGVDQLDNAVDGLQRRGLAPQRLIITRSVERDQLGRLLEKADSYGMTLARLPRLTEFKEGEAGEKGKVEPRPIAVEDLLRRPQARLDRSAMVRLIEGRRVLVTGAGGSIGSELARQAAEFEPARLVLLDHSEYLLYDIGLDIGERARDLPCETVLGDVRDRNAVKRLFVREQPEVVLHAAAVKHVPFAEESPIEAVLTNVVGTRNVTDCARSHGAATMVQVSTDKAVNPSSVMGATKRLAESYAQACDIAGRGAGGSGTRFITVRFGNVLGSTGSVVPLFSRQIARGGPVTVTHPEMTRYFMTVREAVQLVLQSSSLGLDGNAEAEIGRIYVLDMGEPVKIDELARHMIRLAGLRPEHDIEIVYTGTRPGEKLFEDLFHAREPMQETAHPSLRLAAARTVNLELLRKGLDDLAAASEGGREEDVLALLQHYVPEWSGSERLRRSGQ